MCETREEKRKRKKTTSERTRAEEERKKTARLKHAKLEFWKTLTSSALLLLANGLELIQERLETERNTNIRYVRFPGKMERWVSTLFSFLSLSLSLYHSLSFFFVIFFEMMCCSRGGRQGVLHRASRKK
jgi:hypothetical protein